MNLCFICLAQGNLRLLGSNIRKNHLAFNTIRSTTNLEFKVNSREYPLRVTRQFVLERTFVMMKFEH